MAFFAISSVTFAQNQIFSKNELITLLDQTIEAKRYWSNLSHAPVKRAFTRSLSSWCSTSWRTEINDRLISLGVAQKIFASLLILPTEHDSQKRIAQLDDLFKQSKDLLESNNIPGHFSRNWLPYTALAVGAAAVLYSSDLQNNLDDKKNTLTQFFNKRVVTPLKKAGDIFYDNTVQSEADLKEALRVGAQKALNEGLAQSLFSKAELASKQLRKNITLEDLRTIRDKVLDEVKLGKSVSAALKTGFLKDSQWSFWPDALWFSGEDSASIEAIKLVAKDVRTKINVVGHYARYAATALIPYGLYKGAKGLHSSYRNSHVVTPLLRDLKDFESLLAEKIANQAEANYFTGMHQYWVAKLEAYLPYVDGIFRDCLEKDIANLKLSLPIEQQYQIVTQIFSWTVRQSGAAF